MTCFLSDLVRRPSPSTLCFFGNKAWRPSSCHSEVWNGARQGWMDQAGGLCFTGSMVKWGMRSFLCVCVCVLDPHSHEGAPWSRPVEALVEVRRSGYRRYLHACSVYVAQRFQRVTKFFFFLFFPPHCFEICRTVSVCSEKAEFLLLCSTVITFDETPRKDSPAPWLYDCTQNAATFEDS